MYTHIIPVIFTQGHTGLGTLRMGGIHPQILLKNGFLTECLLFESTKVCGYNYLITTKYFYCMETMWLQLCCKSHHNFNLILSVLNNYFIWSEHYFFKK